MRAARRSQANAISSKQKESHQMKASPKTKRSRTLAALLVSAAALLGLGAAAEAATAAPKWDANVYWGPTNFQPGERGAFRFEIGNVGDSAGEGGWPKLEVDLPEGFEFDEYAAWEGIWECAAADTPETVTCEAPLLAYFEEFWPKPNTLLGVGNPNWPIFTVNIDDNAPTGPQDLVVRISEGGGELATITEQVTVGGSAADFGIRAGSLEAEALDEDLNPYTQAGGHPFEAVTSYSPTMRFADPALPDSQEGLLGAILPVASVKDVVLDLPVGFTGDPLAAPTCSKSAVNAQECPPSTQVGTAETNNVAGAEIQVAAVYNVAPSRGAPAEFMFRPQAGGGVLLKPVLRSDLGWGLSVQTKGITEINPLFGVEVRLWGVPADPAHDQQRCENPSLVGLRCAGYTATGNPSEVDPEFVIPHSSTAPRRALLTLPTECDGQLEVSTARLSSWEKPGPYTPAGDPDLSSPNWISASASAPPITGCENLDFSPTLKARPTTNAADSGHSSGSLVSRFA